MFRFSATMLSVAFALLLLALPASAESPGQCRAIGNADFSSTEDAPTQILQAQLVAASDDQPEHCFVRGTILSNISFEMLLPTSRWNGKFLQAGCAGFCGRTMAWACSDATRRGYACIVSDMGHRSALAVRWAPSLSALWAYGNDSAQIDHGFRAVHATALAGKAVAGKFYGRTPHRSYFNGCSEGGREALVAAQRFPWDFDGIIAGAPAVDFGKTFLSTLWNARAVRGANGAPLLTSEVAQIVNADAINSCDLNDGIADGVIGDPRRCRLNPRKLVCKTVSSKGCISSAQADAIAALLKGPTTSDGRPIAAGGLSPATAWMRLLSAGSIGRTVPESYGEEFFRYFGFSPAPGPSWSRQSFDFDRDYRRTGVADALMSVTNPDLRRFKAQGGKLLIYHGWDDHLIAPGQTVDYYESVRATMGGQENSDDFMRLFMVPGMDHCALGNGAWAVDFLSSLEGWVEKGHAPDTVVGVHPRLPADPAQIIEKIGRFPVPADQIVFERPIFRFPLDKYYRGHGDPANPGNYGVRR
jgi:feruloyl esterase